MIVNGVTLPDIPADVLAQYPYAILLHITLSSTSGDVIYMLIFGSTPFVQVSASLIGAISDNIFSSGAGYRLSALSGENEWTNGTELENGSVGGQLGEFAGDVYTLVWANHDVYTAVAADESTGEITAGTEIYFPNSEASHSERVSIGRSLVDGYAREVQRLTGTTDQMNAIQIREKLSAVKAGIKIGDVVLPPIPADVKEKFPYLMIEKLYNSNDGTMYGLLGTKLETVFVSKEMDGAADCTGSLYTTQPCLSSWLTYVGDGWMPLGEIDNVAPIIHIGGGTKNEIVWSNYDIYTATAYDDVNKVPTAGTEVYFSERQNFNGVWLPKISEDVLAEYPCGVIIHGVQTLGEMYGLIVTSNPWKYMSAAVWNSFMGSELPLPDGSGILTGFDSELKFTYHCSPNDAVWGSSEEDESNNVLLFPVGVFGSVSYIPVWANNDIVEITAVIDADKNEFTYGSLYFPPLPAIDTDRVSIGYDLCDGIVEEVQRLSGETDKMNALRAYWKLTTVV